MSDFKCLYLCVSNKTNKYSPTLGIIYIIVTPSSSAHVLKVSFITLRFIRNCRHGLLLSLWISKCCFRSCSFLVKKIIQCNSSSSAILKMQRLIEVECKAGTSPDVLFRFKSQLGHLLRSLTFGHD